MIQRDEGGAGYVAMLWSQGYLPYVYSLDNKPPLHYFIYLIFTYFFGDTIIPIRIFNNILFLVSLVFLYLITKDWYDKTVGILSVFIYGIFMNVPVFEGQLALSESLSVPFVIFSVYFCNQFIKRGKVKSRLWMTGVLMSANALILQIQVVGIILLLVMILFSKNASFRGPTQKKFARNIATELSVLAFGVLLPVLIVTLYFWSYGALNELIDCLFFRLFRAYSAHGDVALGYKFLIIVEGLPLWLLSICGSIKCILRHENRDTFLMMWLLLFLCVACIPPHFGHHYSIIIAPTSMLSGIALSSLFTNIKVTSIKKFFKDYEQNTSSLFVLTILTLSFALSVAFQAEQYPNYSLNWGGGFINLTWADMYGSYDQQVELANYLKTHASNEPILVHGWDPTTYWLSGHMAPSIYVYTIRVGLDIPKEDYNEIFENIRNGHFKYIVMYPDLFGQDPITNVTQQKYSYVKNIGSAQIFSKIG